MTITRDIISHVWEQIEAPRDTDPRVFARQLDSVALTGGAPLLTIDAAGQRHLLIPVPADTRITSDTQSAGLHLLLNKWEMDGEFRQYVDVQCLKPHLNDLFDAVVYEILAELTSSSKQPAQVCSEALERWRELISREPGHAPDMQKLIGLWGELQMLKRLTKLNQNAVTAWTGPFGARFDFNFQSAALEVKTTTRRKGLSVVIHGHDQLEPPTGGSLYLAVLRVEETPLGGETLLAAINALIDDGCDRRALMSAAAELGFTPDILARVNAVGFRLLETRLYLVQPGFPRISSGSFTDGRLPAGIISLTYEIDLTSAPPYPLSEADTESFLQTAAAETDA